MKLYFVRHGETEWNVKKKIQGKTDIPLNENGIRQAKELACQLVEEDISVNMSIIHRSFGRQRRHVSLQKRCMRPVFRWMDWWR